MTRVSKTAKTMAEGAKPLMEFCEEQDRKTTKRYNDIDNQFEELREWNNEVVDLLGMNTEEKKEYIEYLKDKRKKDKKLAKYTIKIISDKKEDKEFVNNLRKTYSQNGHNAYLKTSREYLHEKTEVSDYEIFIQVNGDVVGDSSWLKIYSYYGMVIRKKDKQLTVTYDEKYNIDDFRDKFISYYESVVATSMYKSENLSKLIDKRKKPKEDKKLLADKMVNAAESFFDKVNDKTDKMEDIPGGLLLLASFPAALVGVLASIPVGLSETVIDETVENLRNKKFDSAFLGDAQRQILMVKLTDYIKDEQIRNAK